MPASRRAGPTPGQAKKGPKTIKGHVGQRQRLAAEARREASLPAALPGGEAAEDRRGGGGKGGVVARAPPRAEPAVAAGRGGVGGAARGATPARQDAFRKRTTQRPSPHCSYTSLLFLHGLRRMREYSELSQGKRTFGST